MNNLPVLFNYENAQIRTFTKEDNTIWFVASDICHALGLTNVTKAVSRIEEDDFTSIQVTDSIGRPQETKIINESGLYNLVLSSKKAEAKKFKKWITSEVLPEIRKTGSYNSKPAQPALPQNYEQALETLLASVKEKNKLAKQLEESQEQVNTLTPLALYASQQFSMIQKLPLSVFGKYLSDKVPGMGRNKISAFLISEGYLFRDNKTKVLSVYSQYLKIDSKTQFFNLKDVQHKEPVYSYENKNGKIIKTQISSKIVTSFQIEILKSGMEKVIELCHKRGLISNQQYIEISRDLPQWISTAEYVPAQEYQQQLLIEGQG